MGWDGVGSGGVGWGGVGWSGVGGVEWSGVGWGGVGWGGVGWSGEGRRGEGLTLEVAGSNPAMPSFFYIYQFQNHLISLETLSPMAIFVVLSLNFIYKSILFTSLYSINILKIHNLVYLSAIFLLLFLLKSELPLVPILLY